MSRSKQLRDRVRRLKHFNKLVSIVVALSALAVGYALYSAFAASATTLYLSPASQRVKPDTTVVVDVRLKTAGETVNAVQADLTYPVDALRVVSLDTTNSAFAIEASSMSGDGHVSIARGNIQSVSGDVLVARLTFKTLPGGGNARIEVAGTSVVASSAANTNVLGDSQGATVHVTGAKRGKQ